MLETLPDQAGADFEQHRLVGGYGKGDGSREELEGLGDAVGDGRGDERADALRQQPRDMLHLMRVGVGRHVRPVRFGRAGRQNHRPLLLDRCRDLHLRHVAHAVFHRRSVQFVSRRNEEFDSHP